VQALYGDGFSRSVQSLAILLPNIAIVIFGELPQQFMATTGREKRLPPILLSAVITNLVTNAILIPILGAVGAAIATLFSEFVLVLIALTVIIRIGYKRVGKTIGFIAVISLVVTAIPSLILYGLKPIIGIGLMISCIAGLVILMQRGRFLHLPISPKNGTENHK
jgi:O-antigen/teichoic acid export membrane protein